MKKQWQVTQHLHNTSNKDSDKFLTKQSFDDKLAFEEGLLGIGQGFYSHVKGKLQTDASYYKKTYDRRN